MTEKDKKEILEYISKELKLFKRDLYFETENVLRTYNYNKIIIEKNNKRIQDIYYNGIIPETKRLTIDRVKGGKIEYNGIPEKEINRIEYLQEENLKIEKRIIRIENALECIKDEPNYNILEMRYFNGYTLEKIEQETGLSVKAIRYNLNKMIKNLQPLIFPEIMFQEIN